MGEGLKGWAKEEEPQKSCRYLHVGHDDVIFDALDQLVDAVEGAVDLGADVAALALHPLHLLAKMVRRGSKAWI